MHRVEWSTVGPILQQGPIMIVCAFLINEVQANAIIDGVATYTNYTGTVAFFDRLGVDIVEPDEDGTYTSYYADFTTGETVDYVAPSVTDELLALETFYNVSSLYQDLFLPSYANWPAPDDIPEDLLMPFRDFAIKYNLNDTMLVSIR